MSGITARSIPDKLLIICLLLALYSVSASAQPFQIRQYRAKIILQNGDRVFGIIGRVTDETLTLEDADWFGHSNDGGTVALHDVKKLIIKLESRRKARLTGAVVGGVLTTIVVANNTRKNQFRSSAITAVNVTLTIAVGAGLGMLAGHLIGNTRRVVVRPVGTDPETIARSIRLQTEPFSSDYQQRLMNNQ